MDIYERIRKIDEERFPKSALQRIQEGDHTPQAIAELSAYYLRLIQCRHERRDEMHRWHVEDIWERYRELDLGHTAQYWAGKPLKAPLVHAILEVEFPTQEYEEALCSVGVDPQSIYHYSHTHISRKHWQIGSR